MQCMFPLPAIHNPNGLDKILIIPRAEPQDSVSNWIPQKAKYKAALLTGGQMIHLRCGKCIGCKITKSEEWAVRCVHEAREHDRSMFVTLTYAPDQAPCVLTYSEKEERDKLEAEREAEARATGKKVVKEPPLRGIPLRPKTLHYADFQDFMKRLRKYATTHYGSEAAKRISYLVCGEYTQAGVPHYHALIFGLRMHDLFQVGRSKKIKRHNARYKLYGSKTLENLWGHGFITIGEVNAHTAAYVAQYTTKKLRDGETDCKTYDEHFYCYNQRSDGTRTEYYKDGRRKEFMRCSLKKPIGLRWIIKRESIEDVYIRGKDKVVFMNKKGKVRFINPPRFYDRVCEKYYPEIWQKVQNQRIHRKEGKPPLTYEVLCSSFNIQQHKLSSKWESRNAI